MFAIDIDTTDLQEELTLSESQVKNLLKNVSHEVAAHFVHMWENEANVLKKSRERYKKSLRVDFRDDGTGVVYMHPAAWLPNAIEVGKAPYDMKPAMLASPKARMSKEGKKYLIIPFRFATPGAIADSEIFSGQLPPEVHKAAKKTKGPLATADIPSQYQIPQSAELREEVKSMTVEQAKVANIGQAMTSPYSGVQKKNGGYVNFRIVSENSPQERFMHPGFDARELGQKALSKLDSQIPTLVKNATDNYLSQIGF